jgi:hypothetical protein
LLSLSFAAIVATASAESLQVCDQYTRTWVSICLVVRASAALLGVRDDAWQGVRGDALLGVRGDALLGVQGSLLLGGWECPGSAGAALLSKHEAQLLRRF